jgi:hypothetical protein
MEAKGKHYNRYSIYDYNYWTYKRCIWNWLELNNMERPKMKIGILRDAFTFSKTEKILLSVGFLFIIFQLYQSVLCF